MPAIFLCAAGMGLGPCPAGHDSEEFPPSPFHLGRLGANRPRGTTFQAGRQMDFPAHISSAEFERPDDLHPDLVAGLGDTRQWLSRPMNFSRSSAGTPIHPHGDAVAPDSSSHAPASLHRTGIDHVASYRQGRIVLQADSLCLACDWDCDSENPDDLFETFLILERLNLWSAIGLYPAWHRPGFHVDLRPSAHPSYRARWFRDGTGEYRALSWANWKEHAL